jgi:hypothetical protein
VWYPNKNSSKFEIHYCQYRSRIYLKATSAIDEGKTSILKKENFHTKRPNLLWLLMRECRSSRLGKLLCMETAPVAYSEAARRSSVATGGCDERLLLLGGRGRGGQIVFHRH